MPEILAGRTCRHLFAAQVVALLGTGRPRWRPGFWHRIYLATPRLRGLLALNLTAAAVIRLTNRPSAGHSPQLRLRQMFAHNTL